ncbi:Carbohydrate esterase family 4 protein [Mycena kentingensis (nom. inval.)]|nr:Carbohydrate esterase family 4 protein [Mycena kentingensis (nom. inval.)]
MRLSLFLGILALKVAGAHNPDAADIAQCSWYNYQPVTDALNAGKFPKIWDPCKGILPGDIAGRNKFASFSSKIPNIAPKGTMGQLGNQIQTYPSGDPDCWWTYKICTNPKHAGLKPDIANVPEPRTLGYAFDDGPNCSHNAFYDYLNNQQQKATMFFIGSNVMNWPHEAQRAVTDGHEICVHTWSHRYMTAFTNEQAFAELWYTMQAIKLVTGYTPRCWRPPNGDIDDRIRAIAQYLGLDTILWKYNSNDWEVGLNGVTSATVRQNYENLAAAARNGTFNKAGAIILAHELNKDTMQMAMDCYPNLRSAFSHIVPIAVAQNKTHPYAETSYSMPNFAQYIAAHSMNAIPNDEGAVVDDSSKHAVGLPVPIGGKVAAPTAVSISAKKAGATSSKPNISGRLSFILVLVSIVI